jgi:hypothetical protein
MDTKEAALSASIVTFAPDGRIPDPMLDSLRSSVRRALL